MRLKVVSLKLKGVRPVKLKYNSPIDISEICDTLKSIVITMRGVDINNQENDVVRKKLMEVRPMIDSVMNMLISTVGEEKEERWTDTFFERIKGEIRTFLNFLDKTEDDLLSGTTATTGQLHLYQARLETAIKSIIYDPVYRANLKEDSPDRWTACLWDEMRKGVGLMVKTTRSPEEEEEVGGYEEVIGEEEGEEEEAIKEAMDKKEKAEGLLKDLEGEM